MDGRAVLAWCRFQAGVSEETPFGPDALVFKVGGTMFAACSPDRDPPTVTLKTDPDFAEALRAQYPGVLPGYHMNKRHWNTVVLDGRVPSGVVQQLLEQSYALVARPTGARGRSRSGGGM
jgi:predicted DNA-binding protein (MmcQ/YjbR family)